MPIPLKLTKEEFEAMPASIQEGYTQQADGSYKLGEVPGMVDKTKVDEFRENNRTLQTQLEELGKKMELFKDVDPEKFRELQEQQRKISEKELIEAGDIDQIVDARVKPILAERDKVIETLKRENETSVSRLSQLMIDDTAASLAAELGVAPTALMDVKGRARSLFRVQNGKVVALDEEGKTVYGPDGITPVSLDRGWMEGLKKNATHLFTPASGTGAEAGGGTRSGTGQDRATMSSVQKISSALNEADA